VSKEPTLDEIQRKLDDLPHEELQKVAEQAYALVPDCWIPNPGPQEQAYNSPADILLYGGQAGGGKSALVTGLALTRHKNCLLIRRQYSDMGSIIEDTLKQYGSRDGFNGSAPATLRTRDGRRIVFGGAKDPGDEEHYKGQPFDLLCVGRDTPVLMGDGSYLAIQDLKVGMRVQTLQGARRVTRIYPVRRDDAVRIITPWGSQVQSATHSLLTTAGWVSHDTFGGSFPSSISVSSGYRLSPHTSPVSEATHRSYRTAFSSSADRFRRIFARLPQVPGRRLVSEISVSLARLVRGIDAAGSYGLFQETRRLLLSFAPQELLLRLQQLSLSPATYPRYISENAESDGPIWSLSGDSMDRCSGGRDPCDGRTRKILRDARLYLHQSACVAPPIPTGSQDDGREQTPKRTFRNIWYAHPYTMDERRASESVFSSKFSYESLGVVDLYDIEVDGENHYITQGGFINQNCLDEASQFLESQFRFLSGWNRSTEPGQRCRIILATNPPEKPSEGQWLMKMFEPWLDPHHPNPAEPGELRWYVSDEEGEDQEVDGPEPVQMGHDQDGLPRYVKPLSRTFIPARLTDNPFLTGTGYDAKLDSLPEPLRSAVRDGNWMISHDDDEWQVIPTNWVLQAQQRWHQRPPMDVPMCAIGVDVAQGGKDRTVLAPRYGNWFARPLQVPGKDTRSGADVAALVMKYRKNQAEIIVDMGGGYGGATYEHLRANQFTCHGFKGQESSAARTADRLLGFYNKRAEAYWKFREALDPDQPGGSDIALPPDRELLAELVASRYEMTKQGIRIEPKSEIKTRLGRSPDLADSIIMAFAYGSKHLTHGQIWRRHAQSAQLNQHKVVRGYERKRRRR